MNRKEKLREILINLYRCAFTDKEYRAEARATTHLSDILGLDDAAALKGKRKKRWYKYPFTKDWYDRMDKVEVTFKKMR